MFEETKKDRISNIPFKCILKKMEKMLKASTLKDSKMEMAEWVFKRGREKKTGKGGNCPVPEPPYS